MRKIGILILIAMTSITTFGQNIVLNKPDMNRGSSMMQAFADRVSNREFFETPLNLQDLSDLLWTANGINRDEEGKKTAPSAMNSQDVDLYVLLKEGCYFYDAKKHQLDLISQEDLRPLVAGKQDFVLKAPVILLMVSDISRFNHGDDDLRMSWANMDAGYVSQNICLFCAANNLNTVPRGSMDKESLHKKMNLKESQKLILNNPVSYKK